MGQVLRPGAAPDLVKPMTRYLHKPNIGDAVYALPVVRELAGGFLFLDCRAMPWYRGAFLRALSFLRRQPYIDECAIYSGQEWDTDLDRYLLLDQARERHHVTLVDSHFRGIGLQPPGKIEPWLVAKPIDARYPVVVHRSPRYHGPVDYGFLASVKPGDLFCVGWPDEAAYFRQTFGATYLPTPTLDRLASIINAAGVFIGNQSAPLAIAAGLGKNRLVEEYPVCRNCTFGHENEIVLTPHAEENRESLRRLGYDPPRPPRAPATPKAGITQSPKVRKGKTGR
jgi:hypothetical protein